MPRRMAWLLRLYLIRLFRISGLFPARGIYYVGSSEALSVNTVIGAREPLHCTALGKAILACVGANELKDLLAPPLKRYTRRTVTSLPELRLLLRQACRNGYAIDNEEYVDGIRCVAAPIMNDQGYPIAAIGVSAPKFRLSMEKVRRFGELVHSAALEISRRAGFDSTASEKGR